MNNPKNNMILAFGLAALVLFAWQYFVATPAMKAEQARQANLAHQEKAHGKPRLPPRRPACPAWRRRDRI